MKIDLKGIQSNISELNTNGSAQDVIGLRNKYGEWKPIYPVVDIQQLSASGESYYIHFMNEVKYYWYYNRANNYIQRYKPENNTFPVMKALEAGEEFYSFIHFGNFFMINTSLGSYKFIYDEGAYVELPELPKLKWHIETDEREVLEKTEYSTVMDDGLWQSRILSLMQESINNAVEKGKTQGHALFILAFETISGEYIMPTPIQYNYLGSVLYEENRYNSPNGIYEQDFNQDDDPVDPEDSGTFTRPSDIFGSMITYGMSQYETSDTSDNFIYVLHGGFFVKPKIVLDIDSSVISIIEKYKGLITNVSVFMTNPIRDYNLDNDIAVYEAKTCNTSVTEKINNFLFYPSKGITEVDLMSNNLSFYKLGAFDLETIIDGETEKTFEVKSLATKEVFKAGVSHGISGKECLDYNDRIHIGSVTNKLSDTGSLSINDSIMGFHHPTPTYFSEGYAAQADGVFAIVNLKINGEVKTVITEFDEVVEFDSGTNIYYILNPIISYPDSRAYEMTIVQYTGGDYRIVLDTKTLTPHESLNIAYNLNTITRHPNNYTYRRSISNYLQYSFALNTGLTFDIVEYYYALKRSAGSGTLYTGTTVNNRYYQDKNRIQLSANSDPLSWPAINSYRIGRLDQEIKSLAVNTIQLSEGQYGEHPLMVFSESGIWAMVKGNDSVYSSSVPVSTDVIINNKAVPTKLGIVFVSKRGIVLQSGRESLVLSQGLDGEFKNNIHSLSQFIALTDGTYDTGSISDYLTAEGLLNYENVVIGYDFDNDELYASFPGDYTFIFNSLSKQWYKRKESWTEFVMDSGSLYGITSLGMVQNINGLSNFLDSTEFIYVSNPISIDNTELKKYMNIKLPYSGTNKSIDQLKYNLGVYVFGSNNLQEWKMIAGKRFRQTRLIELNKVRVSAKYHIIVIAGNQANPVFKDLKVEFV